MLSNLGFRDLGEKLGITQINTPEIEFYTEALAVDKKVYGEEHPEVATSLRFLGTCKSKRGQKPSLLNHFMMPARGQTLSLALSLTTPLFPLITGVSK